jgi:hypothetical protein
MNADKEDEEKISVAGKLWSEKSILRDLNRLHCNLF